MSSNLQTQLERAIERLLGPRDALDADTRPLLKALIAVACAAEHLVNWEYADIPLSDVLTQLRALLSEGVKGEFYPCKPDIFEATYEPV